MKILYIPQISSKSSTGEVLLNKDSNMAFFFNLANSAFGSDNEIDLLIEFDISDEKQVAIYPYCKHIIVNRNHQYTTAFEERMHFDIDFYKFTNLEKYDIIFINEPTKVSNVKTLLGKDCKTKIVCYNHWLAFKNVKHLALRQIEGMLNSDLCLLNSEYAIREVEGYCETHGLRAPKMRKVQPSFDASYFDEVIKPLKVGPITGIVYNHRLSSDPYYATAFDNLMLILDFVEANVGEQNMPTVYFTNPSGKEFNVEGMKPYFKQIDLKTQEDYYCFLASDAVQIHLNTFFESEGMWSMSTVEAGITGNICLIPRIYGYQEIFEKTYSGYCDYKSQMVNKLSDIILGKTKVRYNNSSLMEHNNQYVGSKLNGMIEGELELWER